LTPNQLGLKPILNTFKSILSLYLIIFNWKWWQFMGNYINISKIIGVVIVLIIICSIILIGYIWPNPKWLDKNTIVLYGFSVKGEVFDEKIIPNFEQYWEEKNGKDLKFETTYAGSGKITQQVITGAPAEVMILSTEWDAIQLKKEGFVNTDWNSFPYNGTISKSPWVILTRSGNPKEIEDFRDLAKEGIELIHADPLTSGGACWSIYAIYGSELIKTELNEGEPNSTSAKDLLKKIMNNVISWQSSARKALSQFSLGYGDILITYENEALLSVAQDKDYEIIYPKCTIYSQHKVVKVDKNIITNEDEVVNEFIDFLYNQDVQRYLAEYHFRSVNDEINKDYEYFPEILIPFTVEYLGGWEMAHKNIIENIFMSIKG
jgi:sulfate transport system substrate-binding protein